jgi:serine protease AprX
MDDKKNPIKHIKFSERDYFQPPVFPGGNSIPHKEVTDEFKQGLLESIDNLRDGLVDTSGIIPTSVSAAVVELDDRATAKSNRPTGLFNESTCPFFGDMGYSKFLIQISDQGLSALKEKIERSNSKAATKEISAIKAITKYEPAINVSDDIEAISVRLFRFNLVESNAEMDQAFEEYVDGMGGSWEKHNSRVVRLYRVSGNTPALMQALALFSGVQSIISSRCIKIQPMSGSSLDAHPATMTPPIDGVDYPVVAVVDSGVSTSCTPIDPWIVGRTNCVPAQYKNDTHGTFVSGIISNGYNLNGQDQRFPECQAKVFSIEVLGDNAGDLYEIVNAMYEVAKQYGHIKVWNLSLGGDGPVSMSEISTMALMIDEFQDRHDCLCVVAAGNYEGVPRPWPPVTDVEDGISTPGDSVRSLTVGSLAHVDGFVKNEEPSHFSRKGPVSNYVQKPEVVHYGGNIMHLGGQAVILGVNSVDVNGLSANDIGTSFSTPIVSAIAANLFQEIGTRSTPSLVKALVIHSANLVHTINVEHKPYFGWGVPQQTNSILSVQDYESTMVFEGQAQKSFEIEKLPFPIPECLRTDDRKVRAEFFITLVYQPELDANKAFEYCQIDLQVGFGEIDPSGKFTSRVPLQKGEHKFEADLVKSGDKWSPVKVYQARFPRGVDIEDWRLRVKVLDRDGYEAQGVMVPFSIVLTVRDIDREQPVYNEMSRLMEQHNWEVSNLVVDTKIKV